MNDIQKLSEHILKIIRREVESDKLKIDDVLIKVVGQG